MQILRRFPLLSSNRRKLGAVKVFRLVALFHICEAMSSNSVKVIDSHLHVWANKLEATEKGYPYASGQEPPVALQDSASTTALIQQMNANGVQGSLIVQPINHKYDHSYVMSAINDYPDRFKGMLLHDPSLSPEEAVSRLENLSLKGFVGVRFNPYLWPKTEGNDGKQGWVPMSTPNGGGLAVYRRCAELNMPVGVMCFQGLQLHYEDIVELLKDSPKTTLILDHFGFTSFTPEGDSAFQQLLKLAEHPQVIVKISALFRLKDNSPYEKVRTERFLPLLSTFGAQRLMFGTDFPFVLEQEPERYGGMVKLVSSWIDKDTDRAAIMGGTAERVFGAFGPSTSSQPTNAAQGDHLETTSPKQKEQLQTNLSTTISWLVSKIGATTSTLVAGTFFAVLAYKRDALMVSFFIGSILNAITSKILKRVIKQSRPTELDEKSAGWKPSDNGMPSSHAMSLGFIGTFTAMTIPWAQWPLLIYVVISLTYRVQAKFHTLEQILVGVLIGSINGAMWRKLCIGDNPFEINVMQWVAQSFLNERGLLPVYMLAVPVVIGGVVVGSLERRIAGLLDEL